MNRPGVGIGIIIQNKENKILIGKRKGSHSPFYSIPGGHLENGETFEEAAIKEVFEETGLSIKEPIVVCVTNNLRTFQEESEHFVSIIMFTNQFTGQCTLKEPDKCEEWFWCDKDKIPNPQFDASEFGIECFLKNTFYIKDQNSSSL